MDKKLVPILCAVLIVGGIIVTFFGIRNVTQSRQAGSTVVYDWTDNNTGVDTAAGSDMNTGNSSDGVVTAQTELNDGVELTSESTDETVNTASSAVEQTDMSESEN